MGSSVAARPVRSAAGCPAPGADAPCCATHRRKTPPVDVGRIRYPYHPWFDRDVWIVGRCVRHGQPIWDCRLDPADGPTREVPAWMFEAATCAAMTVRAEPRIAVPALRHLRDLLAAGGLYGPHPFAPRRGDADVPDPIPGPVPAAADAATDRPPHLGDPGGGRPARGRRAPGPDAPRPGRPSNPGPARPRRRP